MQTNLLPQTSSEVHGKALSWDCFRVTTGQEKRLRDALIMLGVEHYLPMLSSYFEGQYFKGWRVRPMFPGYLFAGSFDIDMARRFVGIKTWFESIGEIDLAFLAEIQSREEGMGYCRLVRHTLSVGDLVEIDDGPFRGVQRQVDRIISAPDAAERIGLLLPMLGRESEFIFDRHQLRRVIV